MKIETVSITPGVSFGTAQEIPCSTARPATKQVGSKSSGNGVKRQKNVITVPGKLLGELQRADREITAANKKVMILVNGKRRFVREADYRAGQY